MLRKYQKHRKLAVAGLVAISLIAISAIYYSKTSSKVNKDTGSVTVGARGGTFKLDDVIVVVPEGAVQQDTKLSISEPVFISGDDAPLGASKAVRFDLSFADGVEPAEGKPLEVTIPLSGNMLPEGADPTQALFYTHTTSGENRILVPSTVNEKGELQVSLAHLSEKEIIFLNNEELLNLIKNSDVATGASTECLQEIENTNDGYTLTVSSSDTNRALACLVASDAGQVLQITNRANFIYSVISSDVKMASTEALEANDTVVTTFASIIDSSSGSVDSYMVRESTIQGVLDPDNDSSVVTLTASASVGWSEVIWKALRLFVETTAGGMAATTIADIVLNGSVLPCITGALSGAERSDDFLTQSTNMVKNVLDSCAKAIINKTLEVVGETAFESSVEALVNYLTGLGIILGLYDVISSAAAGLIDNLKGDVTVKAEREYYCISDEEALTYMTSNDAALVEPTICKEGWAIVSFNDLFSESDPDFMKWGGMVFHYEDGAWNFVTKYYHLYAIGHDEICNQLPDSILYEVCYLYPDL